MFPADTWEVSLSGSHTQGCGQLQDAWICCRGMCCGSIPSGSDLGLLQRGFKEPESQGHTSWCSFTSPGTIHHAEPRAAHLPRDRLMEPLVSAHTSTLSNKPCYPVLSTACPHHVTSENQTPTSADNHSGTRLGDTREFAEPLKARERSFFGGSVTIGRLEPPAPLPDRPAPTWPAQVSFSLALFAFPAAWLAHRSCTFPGTDVASRGLVIGDTPAGLPPVGTGCGARLAWGAA